MAYIYKITNDINGKIYIGKTVYNDIQERWKEHLGDYKKRHCEKRPLYAAMNKYGAKHFHIEPVEKVENLDELADREVYWIAYYDLFKNGYNATLGGDGKKYIDYDLVVATYKEVRNYTETARILHIHPDSVVKILKIQNVYEAVDVRQRALEDQKKYGKSCAQIDLKTGEVLNTFMSLKEAARQFMSSKISKDTERGISGHIGEVCNGKRKSAYGFGWKFIEKND